MKNTIVILLVALSSATAAFAQQQVTWKKWGLKYETPEKLKSYKTGSDYVYGRENDNYAVDIEVVSLKKVASDTSSIERRTLDMATSMAFKNVTPGGAIPNIKKAYYVIAENTDINQSVHPVIIMIIINESLGMEFEISIYCYNKDVAKGTLIAKSFAFAK